MPAMITPLPSGRRRKERRATTTTASVPGTSATIASRQAASRAAPKATSASTLRTVSGVSGTPELRSDFAALIRESLEESPSVSNPVGAPIREHLGLADEDLAVHAEQLSDFELPNLQLALD